VADSRDILGPALARAVATGLRDQWEWAWAWHQLRQVAGER
jgi:hypothetical protein